MNPLYARISQSIDINRNAFAPLLEASSLSAILAPDEAIILEGDTVRSMFVIESGWAIRYRILNDGRRQILNVLLPGDCFGIRSILKSEADHNISAVTDMQFRSLNVEAFVDIVKKDDKLTSAFWWVALQEEAIFREHIIRVGARTATERLVHLLLELNQRVSIVEGGVSDFLRLPVPQLFFADALSLSVVHISRTFTKLKLMGVIEMAPGGIKIMDREKMVALSGFDDRYLNPTNFKLIA